jgi:predicted transcriptional regulator
VADELMRGRSRDASLKMIEEIESDLRRTTQNVREILDNPQSEEGRREFLHAIVNYIRAKDD